MKVIKAKSPIEVAEQALQLLQDFYLKKTRPIKIFLPTGKTPKIIYEKMAINASFWKNKLLPLQIDEFVDKERLFYSQLKKEILQPLNLIEETRSIDPNWSDADFFAHVTSVNEAGIDVSVLGIGPNGHIGFHEPGLGGASFLGGRVTISDETKNRVAGAKTNSAFTFGAGTFLKSEMILLIAAGKEKAEILKKFSELEPVSSLPATLLKIHSQFIVLTDQNF